MKASNFDRAAFLDRLDAMDRALVAAGFPEMSPWWRATLRRYFLSGRRSLVLRVGRRGGKSSTLCRVAVAWALWGSHRIPPGDTGVIAFISVSRDESAQRLVTIRAILEALGVAYRAVGDEVSLLDRSVTFKTYTATIAGVSGPTCIMIVGDELSKWRDADTGANPASRVVSTAKPTVATQPDAPMFWSSSAFGREDYHCELFDRGDTDDQLTAFAETWIANPTITEDETRRLERDEKVWAREYAGLPQGDDTACFMRETIDAMLAPIDASSWLAFQPVIVSDPSRGRGDSYVFAAAQFVFPPPPEKYQIEWYIEPHKKRCPPEWIRKFRRYTLDPQTGNAMLSPEWLGWAEDPNANAPHMLIHGLDAIDGRFAGRVTGHEIALRIAGLAHSVGAVRVYGDQAEQLGMGSLIEAHELRFEGRDWGTKNKHECVTRIRQLASERRLHVMDPTSRLRDELLGFRELITPSGSIRYAGRSGVHDDRVSVVLMAALAESERSLEGSDIARPRHSVKHIDYDRG